MWVLIDGFVKAIKTNEKGKEERIFSQRAPGVCVYIYMYVYMYVCMDICVCVRMYVCGCSSTGL